MDRKATTFEFTSYDYKPAEKQVLFHYTTIFDAGEPIRWTETIILPEIPGEVPTALLESLHIMLGISYYKFYCLPADRQVRHSYSLTQQQADFWNTVYKKGLGEFFYRNNLDPKISPKFTADKNAKPQVSSFKFQDKSLIGIGGGKDSLVVAELLKQANHSFDSFLVTNKPSEPLVEQVIKQIPSKALQVQRVLDEKVRQPHAYNGHVPVSAIYAFLGIFSCLAYGYKYIIVGNEQSSNFGNIKYKGLEINHQWSKSFEFETLFRDYIRRHIATGVEYFSLLRPLHEIRIAELFAKHKQYFPYFSSCNRNFTLTQKEHGGLWCGNCPKCVFTFTMLSVFLPKKELLGIFGQNLYTREDLLPLFKDVLGLGTMKPFDCVGTFPEAQTAFSMATKKFTKYFIMRQLVKKTKQHPEVFETSAQSHIPDHLKFLGMKNALILGFGKEGKITKQYLKKQYPALKVSIGDSALDKNYLKKQKGFDIAVKTPGIQKELVTIAYTTATNLFFSHIKGKYPIIGITGSKGKSTTSTLIFEILKAAGKHAVLLGNIGKPMLEALLQPITEDTVFVLELSSAQLDDIHYSPDIAVVTNLFPEHMDYHGSLKNYYAAKKNIINFQEPKDHFVHNEKTASWLKGYQGIAVPFAQEQFESNLLGPHNQSNINAAVAVARILQIPDEITKQAIKEFRGLPHRLENVGTYIGITFYDDAISTTPESTIMAIKSVPGVSTIFLGGQDRGYDFSALEKELKKHTINNIVLFPDSGKKIIKHTKGLNILHTKSMKEAVAFAYKHTPLGSACLLSCASPSYSLWKNFEVKGDEFKKFVVALAKP